VQITAADELYHTKWANATGAHNLQLPFAARVLEYNQVCVNLTQVCVNLTQVCVNLTQVCVNLTQACVNLTQVCVNLTQVCVNLTQAVLDDPYQLLTAEEESWLVRLRVSTADMASLAAADQ
jgi:hypothetical protein